MQKHSNRLEVFFPILVLLVFAISAITVVLLSARTYQHIVVRNNENYDTRTAMNYIREKVRSVDTQDSILVAKFDGCEALALKIDDTHTTWLYVYNGSLRELTLQNDTVATASSGTEILQLNSMEVTLQQNHLLRIDLTSKDEIQQTTLIAIHSGEGGTNA